jgi:hypothetical protein
MKKQMVCVAFCAVLALGAALPGQAAINDYALPASELEGDELEDDGLPADYEFEIEETDQPFITDDSFSVEEEGEGAVSEEWREEGQGDDRGLSPGK